MMEEMSYIPVWLLCEERTQLVDRGRRGAGAGEESQEEDHFKPSKVLYSLYDSREASTGE